MKNLLIRHFLRLWSWLIALASRKHPTTAVAVAIPVQFGDEVPTVFGPQTIVKSWRPDGEPKKVLYQSRATDRWLAAKVVEYDQTTDRFKLARRAHPIYRRAHRNPVAA
ncbi:MAG: hypothetical protein NTY66_02300 [Candidatus Vogelbacteria bacterium]|nr:hypothetical protein [Candidatus Vogelbacteria bacterium]